MKNYEYYHSRSFWPISRKMKNSSVLNIHLRKLKQKTRCSRDSNPIQDRPFRGCSRMKGGEGKNLLHIIWAPLPKICHTYSTMMKLGSGIPYLKRSQNYINHVTHHLSSADISTFAPEMNRFFYIKNYRCRLHF